MLKQLKFSFLAVLAVFAFASCENDSDVRDAARTSVQATPATNPVTPNTPQSVQTPAQPAAPAGPLTSMNFTETEYNFGTVEQGEKVSHTYKFKNTGDNPLILTNAKGSCGCTVPKWPRDPIAPGGEGEVTVEFDSKNKKGTRNQKVTLTANTEPANTVLYLKGEVLVPGEAVQ